MALLIFKEGQMPDFFLIPSEAWKVPNEVFVDRDYNRPGTLSPARQIRAHEATCATVLPLGDLTLNIEATFRAQQAINAKNFALLMIRLSVSQVERIF